MSTFLVILALVLLRDPVLMYAALLAFQLLLFPDLAWLTFGVGVFAITSIYMSHDIVLGDEKAFFIRVDRGIRATTWFVLLMIAVVYLFQIARRFMIDFDLRESWRVAQKAFPILAVMAVNHGVDMQGDGSLFDNLGVAFEYSATLVDYFINYGIIQFNALTASWTR